MPRWLDRPRRAGEAERAVNVRHHRRGRYSPYRRVVSRYPVVHGRLERASSAERMTPTEHVASRIVLDGGRTEGHGYAGQACPGRRCVRGRSHPSRLLPQFLPPQPFWPACRALPNRSPTHLSLLHSGPRESLDVCVANMLAAPPTVWAETRDFASKKATGA